MSRSKGYTVAAAALIASLGLRLMLQPWLGLSVPYLQFFPAITLASWYGGFGPGALATAGAALAAVYFFLPPAGFGVDSTADLVSLPLFIATGLGIAWLSHLFHGAEAAYRTAVELANGRAERLAAVLRTAVDGIIVISAMGEIEGFNDGAARLFGYPAAEVLGRNVSMLMPSPHHEAHDQYLARYLETGRAQIIGTGREVIGRRRDGTTFPLHLSVGEMWIDGERKFTGMPTTSARARNSRRAFAPARNGGGRLSNRLSTASWSSTRKAASRRSIALPSDSSAMRNTTSRGRTSSS
jgi:two-component system sensor kinase FixL